MDTIEKEFYEMYKGTPEELHDYLLSKLVNVRYDEYGSPIVNRCLRDMLWHIVQGRIDAAYAHYKSKHVFQAVPADVVPFK